MKAGTRYGGMAGVLQVAIICLFLALTSASGACRTTCSRNDFSSRMLDSTERHTWAQLPFPEDALIGLVADADIRVFIYTTGYCMGYIAEQAAVGVLTGGATVVAKTLAMNGVKLTGKLAPRVIATIAVRTTVIKKRLSGEMTHLLADSTEEAVGIAASRLAPGTTVKTQTATVIEEGMERLRPPPLPGAPPTGPTWAALVDAIASHPQLAALISNPATLEELLQATALLYHRTSTTLTKEAAANWPQLANRLVKTETDGSLTTRFDDLFALFKADTPEGAEALSKSLNDFTDGNDHLLIKDIEKLQPTAYKYSSFEPSGGWGNYSGEIPQPTWCSFDEISSSELANDLLLLPKQSKNPKFRVEFDTADVIGRARLTLGEVETSAIFEPLTRDLPLAPFEWVSSGTGIQGGGKQFWVEGSVDVKKVIDLATGQQVWPIP